MWRCTIANKERDLFINEQIRAKEVMVIGPRGEQLGTKPIKDALTLASYAGFDLVLINQNSNPPVCKIMDYNKFKYENKKKAKENITIDVHDFDTRVRNAKNYLEKGHKIKASIRFKGREMAHPELGRDVLLRFAEALGSVSSIEQKPVIDGRFIFMILTPSKEK